MRAQRPRGYKGGVCKEMRGSAHVTCMRRFRWTRYQVFICDDPSFLQGSVQISWVPFALVFAFFAFSDGHRAVLVAVLAVHPISFAAFLAFALHCLVATLSGDKFIISQIIVQHGLPTSILLHKFRITRPLLKFFVAILPWLTVYPDGANILLSTGLPASLSSSSRCGPCFAGT